MKYKKIYLTIFFIFFFFLLYFGASNYLVFNFSKSKNAEENNIIKKNKRNFIEINTAKKRLELFRQWSEDDPLMYFTTLNIAEYEKSISRMEKEEEKMQEFTKWEENIFPINFLFSISSSTQAYNDFKENPTINGGLGLLEKMNIASEAYKSDSDDLKNTLDDILEESIRVSIGGKAFTNREVVKNDFEKIKENYFKIKSEIETRRKCLMESVAYCDNDFLVKDIVVSKDNEEIWGETLENDKNYFNYENRQGPYIINSQCFGDESNLMFIYKACPNNLDYCTQNSSLATDFYLHKLSDVDEYSRSLLSKGVLYTPSTGTQPYLCANLEYKPTLALINFFYNNYKDKRIFSQEYPEFNELFIQGRLLEENFFDASYPTEDDFENLSEYYKYSYYYLGVNNIYSDLTLSIRERYLLMEQKIYNFELISNMVVYYFSDMLKNYSLMERQAISKYYVYASRNNYSLFFLGFSSPVWRIENNLIFHTTGPLKEAPQTVFSKYSEFPEEKKDDLTKQIKIYQENPKHLFLIDR